MAEIKTPIKATRVEMGCDLCSEGTFVWGGQVANQTPPSYRHFCNHCGRDAGFFITYPHVLYLVGDTIPLADIPKRKAVRATINGKN